MKSASHLPARRTKSNAAPRNIQRKAKIKAKTTPPACLTLEQMGFIRLISPQSDIPSPSRHQLDQQAQQTDYSGTYVSSGPSFSLGSVES